ncbi:Uu.00g069790.m01.CDS01 [Anthostomella pinea]|uniref:Uu.00g069790.m01.CDS01 n=1 Tax=Anthostomella pinea TaxID=933095 RepID=A0AAI8VVD5_9PEZI|nr:Uu.00g069790.m01.CDS01 [Anthostomella pinea]
MFFHIVKKSLGAVAALANVGSCLLRFVTSPSFDFLALADYTRDAVFIEGSTLTVSVSGLTPGKATSMVLFQTNITNDQVDPQARFLGYQQVFGEWLIAVDHNVFDLSFSNVFILSLYKTGSLAADTNSHYFNISTADAAVGTATTTSSAGRPTSATVASSTALSSHITSSTSAAATPANQPMGLGTGAKVGVGVAIVVAALAGLGAGCFLVRRRQRREGSLASAATLYTVQEGSGDEGYLEAGSTGKPHSTVHLTTDTYPGSNRYDQRAHEMGGLEVKKSYTYELSASSMR